MRFSAEVWDKMQHVMERFNDHMVHGHFEFETTLDFPKLKRAFEIMFTKAPIFMTVFRNRFFTPYWESVSDWNIDEVVKLVEVSGDANKISEEFLTGIINENKEVQIRVLVVRENGKDTLNILHNHMIMDGGDYKKFLEKVAEIYTDLANGGNGDLEVKNGSRNAHQIFRDFTPEAMEKYKSLLSYSKGAKHKIMFPYEKSKKKDLAPFIAKMKLPEDTFRLIKDTGKQYGYTLNVVLFACFYRAIYEMVEVKPGQSLGIPCMIDLRRYKKNGESEGFTNLTSMIVPNLGSDIGENVLETAAKLKENFERLLDPDNFPGLHGLTLLDVVYDMVPYRIAKFLISTFFKNPLIGISNIGVISEKSVDFAGIMPKDCYLTGSIKYPPYIQLATTTYRSEMTFTIASYGTENDKKKCDELLALLKAEFTRFIELHK